MVLRDGRPIVLRPLDEGDAERIAAFFATLTDQETYYFFALDQTAARGLALGAEHDPAYRLVATVGADERLLGYAFLQWRDVGPPVFGVCLHQEAQSNGLGRVLMDHLFTSAAASGVGLVTLTVHPDNGRALRLYQRAGFRLTGEFVNAHQGVKQYRMDADLLAARPAILEDLAIVPVGGVGVGMAAAEVQQAVEEKTGRLPLLLDRPAPALSSTIFVADLTIAPGPRWEQSDHGRQHDVGWVVTLDDKHLLIGGVSIAALTRACRTYARRLAGLGPDSREAGAIAATPVDELITLASTSQRRSEAAPLGG